MKVALKRAAIATSTVTCVALLSFSWSEQRGVSLGIESSQARINRPSTPLSAGVAHRQHQRSVYGRGLFAEAVAATTSPWNYDDYVCYGDPYAGKGYPPGGYYYRNYPGGYCVSSSYVTGLYARPTLFPRYYGGWRW
jgi:hypothetical protein